MINYKKIGDRIRQYRSIRGITQEELAYMIGSSSAYICNVELGKKKPSLQMLSEIADAMNLTVNDFLYDRKPTVTDSITDILALFNQEKQQRIIRHLTEFIQTIIT